MARGSDEVAWRGLRGRRGLFVACGAVVLALVATIVVLALRPGPAGGVHGAATPTSRPSTSASATVAQIFAQDGPSVVIIRTARGALGTGVIATRDGTIITADHVVADRSAISVIFADGTKSAAVVASADPKTDIATLTPVTLPQQLVPATLGGSVQVGANVVAIGNPLGLSFSVSSGVVSGVDRTADTDRGKFSGLIQFDASVNPGSSGGPLLDAKGDVIGIVVSIADPGRDDAFAGVAFAVPIGTALGGGGPGGGPQL